MYFFPFPVRIFVRIIYEVKVLDKKRKSKRDNKRIRSAGK